VKRTQKSALFLLILAIGLAGFVILPFLTGILWLIFMLVVYPVVIAFVSGLGDGTLFTPAELLKLYKESISTLPSLFKFLKDLVPRRKNNG
jgi:hypothetical protein